MSDGAMRNMSPSEAMRRMLNKMAYLALAYAIKGKEKQAEIMKKMVRQMREDCNRRVCF